MNKFLLILEKLKIQKFQSIPIRIHLLSLAVVFTASTLFVVPFAQAVSYDEQIKKLQQQNNNSATARADLQASGETLAARVASLQTSIAQLEGQIQQSQAKNEDLKKKIAETDAEIARQRAILGTNIRLMYLEDDVSTLEQISSSKNISEYADKEQYRNSLQDKIQQILRQIKELNDQQKKQKALVEKILVDQQAMQARIAAEKAEASRLLALNQQQQSQYNQSIATNNSQISQLQRQQAAANARFSSSASYAGTGSYPWANVPFPNTLVDPWGMYKRQCVSYTAWKVASTGRHMPYWGGRGNANNWDDNARAAGIPVSVTPKVGDVAVSNAGTYGHVMYVEAVNGDGTISVSQYNASWDGRYSQARVSTSGLVFIHF